MNKPYDRPLRGNRCQCQGCYEYFNSLSAFELHRIGDYPERRCLTPEEMAHKGMSLNSAGFWVSKNRPKSIVLSRTSSEGAAIS